MLLLRYNRKLFGPIFLLLFYANGFWLPGELRSQPDSSWRVVPEVTFHGFVDVFYVFDADRPQKEKRQDFLFNHNRHNEFNLNLGILGLCVEHPRYRANLDIQTGTYANDNYASEPGVLKNVFQANAGLALDGQGRWWIDAGIFPSHIGFESALSIDNYTLTRSMSAENSPYFLSGAKLSFEPDEHWYFALIATNGWQRIRRVPGNSLLSWGTQITYRNGDRFSVNWSTFIGTDDPDVDRRIRIFHDLYGQFRIGERLDLIAGLDMGFQQKDNGRSETDRWVVTSLIARYRMSDQWHLSGRLENMQDPEEVIVSIQGHQGFETSGASINLDYRPTSNVACRIEGRWFVSPDQIYRGEGVSPRHNRTLTASMAVKW